MAENESNIFDPSKEFDESIELQRRAEDDLTLSSLNTNDLKETLTNMSRGAFQNQRTGSILPKSQHIQNENEIKFMKLINRHKISLSDTSNLEQAYKNLNSDISKSISNGYFWKHQDLMPFIFDRLESVADNIVEQKDLEEINNEIMVNAGQDGVIYSLFRDADNQFGGFNKIPENHELRGRITNLIQETVNKTNTLQTIDANQSSRHVGQYMENINRIDGALEGFLQNKMRDGSFGANDFSASVTIDKFWEKKMAQQTAAYDAMVANNFPFAQQQQNLNYMGDSIEKYTTVSNALFELNSKKPDVSGGQLKPNEMEDWQLKVEDLIYQEQTQKEATKKELETRLLNLHSFIYSDTNKDGGKYSVVDMEFKKQLSDMNSPYFLENILSSVLPNGMNALDSFGINLSDIQASSIANIIDDQDITDDEKLIASQRFYFENVWKKNNTDKVEEGFTFEDYLEAELPDKPEDRDFSPTFVSREIVSSRTGDDGEVATGVKNITYELPYQEKNLVDGRLVNNENSEIDSYMSAVVNKDMTEEEWHEMVPWIVGSGESFFDARNKRVNENYLKSWYGNTLPSADEYINIVKQNASPDEDQESLIRGLLSKGDNNILNKGLGPNYLYQFEETSEFLNEFFSPEEVQTENLNQFLTGSIRANRAVNNVANNLDLPSNTKYRSDISSEDRKKLNDFRDKFNKAVEGGTSIEEFIEQNKLEYLSLARRLKYAKVLLNRNHLPWTPASYGRMPELAKNWELFDDVPTIGGSGISGIRE